MLRLFPAVAACAVFTCAAAQTVYKCGGAGAPAYGDRPCTHGQSTTLAVPPAPAPDPVTAARLARQQALAAQLTARDAARDRQDDQALQRARRAASALKTRCDRLRLRRQWAQEDVQRASGKKADAARLKAQRQAEAMALECLN